MSPVKQGSAPSLVATGLEAPVELDFEQTWDRYIQSLEEMREHARQRQSKLSEMIDAAKRARGRPGRLVNP